MPTIPFPSSSVPGRNPGEGLGRLINAYADKQGDGIAHYRSAGLANFADVGQIGPRGQLLVGNFLFVATQGGLSTVTADGTVAAIEGDLPGTLPVTMARNNRAPAPDIVICTQSAAYRVSGTVITDYPDPDIGSPNSVSFLDGYFLFTYANGTITASELNSTDISTISNARAESKPDALVRGVVYGGAFYAMGANSIEVWTDAGTQPFPLARQEIIPVGLLAQFAVAGFEDGWNQPLIFVASDSTVRRLDGYTPTRISTRDVERDIQSVGSPSALRAMVYTSGGNAFWVLSSSTFTWEYNVTTGAWNERRSHGKSRWRAETSSFAFGRWLVGDRFSTRLLTLSDAALDEAGEPLIARVESSPLKNFPHGIRGASAHFDFTVGQGRANGADPVQTDPQVELYYSRDGGATWSNGLLRSLGKQGEYTKRVSINRLGTSSAHGLRFAWQVSDPVSFQFRGGTLENVSETRA